MDQKLSTPAYVISKKDYLEFSNYHSRGRYVKPLPAYIRWFLYLLVLIGISWFVWNVYSEQGFAGIIGGLPLFFILPVVFAALLFAQHFRWQRLKDEPSFNHENVISISDEGVSWHSAVAHGTQSWIAVFKIAESQGILLIYINPKMAFIIPKRVFPTTQDAEAFLRKAQELKAQSQQ